MVQVENHPVDPDKLNEYPELQKDYFMVLKPSLREQLDVGTGSVSSSDVLSSLYPLSAMTGDGERL